MKQIVLGFLDRPRSVALGTADETTPTGVSWQGPGAFSSNHIAEHYSYSTGLRGEELLDYMLQRMRGRQNWATSAEGFDMAALHEAIKNQG